MSEPKVVLVNPPVWDIRSPPINIAYLTAFLRSSGFPVKAFDFNAEVFNAVQPEVRRFWRSDFHDFWQDERRWYDELKPVLGSDVFDRMVTSIVEQRPDVVGFTMNYSPFLIADLAEAVKAAIPGVVTVAGGNYCEPFIFGGLLLHREAFDLVVLGEGEVTLLEILVRRATGRPMEDIEGTFVRVDGHYIENPRRTRITAVDELPFPDFSDFDLSLYWEPDQSKQATRLPLLFARGCFCSCDFCMQSVIWGKPYAQRSGESLFAEIQRNIEQFGVRAFQFADLAINGDLKKLGRFCDLVIDARLDIAWGGGANIRKGMDLAFLRKLKAAGCEWLDHGLESGSTAVLRSMGKPYDAAMAEAYIRDVHTAGIYPQFSLIVGHPAEGREEFRETLQFLRRCAPYMANVVPSVTVCGVYEHTPLQRKLADLWGEHTEGASMDWRVGDNDFEERRRRVKELHEFVGRYCGQGGIKIDDEEVFHYKDGAAGPEGVAPSAGGAPRVGPKGKTDDSDVEDAGDPDGDGVDSRVPRERRRRRRRQRVGRRRRGRGDRG